MHAGIGRRGNVWRWVVGASVTLALASCMVATPGAPGTPDEGGHARGSLVIQGAGDVSLDPAQIPAFGTHGYGWAWSGLGGLFHRDDLTMVNLECPVTDVVDPAPKAFPLRCDPRALPAAERAGVDVVSQANNHAYDDGPAGLMDSLGAIHDADLVPVGAGSDRADALRAADFQIDGWRIAVLGIDEVLDPIDEVAGPDKPGTAAGHDFALALQAVRDAAASADLVVVMIHWGIELDARPRALPGRAGPPDDRRRRRRDLRIAPASAPTGGDLSGVGPSSTAWATWSGRA